MVDDARTRSVLERPQPELFSCLCQLPGGLDADPLIVVRTRADAASFAPSLRQVIREVDPSIALDAMLTMDQRLMGNLARPRLYAIVLAGFAAFALLIAGVGLFGVLSYSVAQRAREIGVRSALGARPADIIGPDSPRRPDRDAGRPDGRLGCRSGARTVDVGIPLRNRPPRCGDVCRRSNPSADGGCCGVRDAGAPRVATRPVAGLEGALIRAR